MRNIGIYLSGPITHDPDYRRKFDLAERLILTETAPEAVIYNPAAHQDIAPDGKTPEELWAEYMVRDLFVLMDIRKRFPDALLVSLPWLDNSRGSRLERRFAAELGFRLLDIRDLYPDWEKRLPAEGGKV
jgi:hypothetical protein